MKTIPRQGGYTLIEVLIAASILAVMATLVWGAWARTADTRDFVLAAQERTHTVRGALDRMAREISMAFVYDCREPETSTGEIAYRTPFLIDRDGSVDRITFTSFSHLRMFKDANESDQNLLSYYGEPDPEDSSKTNLMRREKAPIDEEFERGGLSLVLCPDIQEMRLELWDDTKEDWVDEWNCSKIEQLNRLPRLVRITLTVIDEYQDEVPYVTTTRIFANKPLSNWLRKSQ